MPLILFTLFAFFSVVVRAGEIVDASYDKSTRTINVALSEGCNKYEYAVDYQDGCTRGPNARATVKIIADRVETNDCRADYKNVVQIRLAKLNCKPPMVVTIQESEGSSTVVEVLD